MTSWGVSVGPVLAHRDLLCTWMETVKIFAGAYLLPAPTQIHHPSDISELLVICFQTVCTASLAGSWQICLHLTSVDAALYQLDLGVRVEENSTRSLNDTV